MRKAIGYLITGTWMFCLLWTLASCSREAAENPDVPSGGEATLNIGFKIPTRAAAEGYEDGETDENYIDIAGENYRIYFFDEDNKFIADFEPSGFITADSSDYRQYNVLGKAPDALVEHSSFKMVVLANWPKYPEDSDVNVTLKEGETTIADICNADWAQYGCLTDGNETNPTAVALDPDAGRLMPFYGVHEYDNVTFKPGVATILSEPVTLLRAMAKVEVILQTDDYFDLSFSSLKIDRYNATGYCAPKDVFHQDSYDHNGNWESDYTPTLHLVGDQNDSEAKELSFRRVRRWDEGGKRYEKWTAYLPEYSNVGAGDAYSSIKAKFDIQLADDAPHTIYFAQYGDGKTDNSNNNNRLNIERNNIYRFQVTCTHYNFKLLLTVSDWQGLYENTFDFGDIQIVSPVSPWEDEKDNDVEF